MQVDLHWCNVTKQRILCDGMLEHGIREKDTYFRLFLSQCWGAGGRGLSPPNISPLYMQSKTLEWERRREEKKQGRGEGEKGM